MSTIAWFRAVICRVREINPLSCRRQITRTCAINCSIMSQIAGEHNTIKSHYAKSAGKATFSGVHLIRREFGRNGSWEVGHTAPSAYRYGLAAIVK